MILIIINLEGKRINLMVKGILFRQNETKPLSISEYDGKNIIEIIEIHKGEFIM